MNKAELLEVLSSKTGLSKKDVDEVVKGFIDVVKETVKKGDDVALVGFGVFSQVQFKARDGVNPATGAKLKIPARKAPKFKPGKAFKEFVK